MKMHVLMLGQEIVDTLGLVRREVVADDVDLFAPALVRDDVAEEGDEFGARVARSGLAKNLAGLDVEGDVEREKRIAVCPRLSSLNASVQATYGIRFIEHLPTEYPRLPLLVPDNRWDAKQETRNAVMLFAHMLISRRVLGAISPTNSI